MHEKTRAMQADSASTRAAVQTHKHTRSTTNTIQDLVQPNESMVDTVYRLLERFRHVDNLSEIFVESGHRWDENGKPSSQTEITVRLTYQTEVL